MYVVLQPHSNTNPSEKHRVAWDQDWQKFANGAASSYAFTDFSSYVEAKSAADGLNTAVKKGT